MSFMATPGLTMPTMSPKASLAQVRLPLILRPWDSKSGLRFCVEAWEISLWIPRSVGKWLPLAREICPVREAAHTQNTENALPQQDFTKINTAAPASGILLKSVGNKCFELEHSVAPVWALILVERLCCKHKIDFHVAAVSRIISCACFELCCEPPAPGFHPHSRWALSVALVHVSVHRCRGGCCHLQRGLSVEQTSIPLWPRQFYAVTRTRPQLDPFLKNIARRRSRVCGDVGSVLSTSPQTDIIHAARGSPYSGS
jgi:hypothetical protein